MGRASLLDRISAELRENVSVVRTRDPAAANVAALEILVLWPGVHALLAHRAAHALREARVPLLPRLVAAAARALTGIEIHPAARIGRCFFIDHGMGVVIGETAQIGDGVTLYQGVTLGGTGFQTGKRHPTLQDNVTVGSGAKLLGPITIGHGAKVGANTVVIHDVPPNTTVVGNPGHPVRVEGRRPEGPDADWVHLPDPVAEAIRALAGRLEALEALVDGEEADSEAVRRIRAAAAAHGEARSNPSLGPSPAGG
jgi:serine O-acetyltransferase